MNKIFKYFTCLGLALFFISGSVFAEDSSVTRISSSNRYTTSVAVSENFFNNSNDVVIASGENFSDALFGGRFAAELNSPLFLSTKDTLDSKVLDEIGRLNVKNIYILGGENSISSEIENSLKRNNFNVKRISGKDRIETAYKINTESFNIRNLIAIGDSYSVVNSHNFADALAAAPFVYQYSYKSNFLSFFPYKGNDDNVAKMSYIIFGGTSSIPKQAEEKNRLAGSDRYKTAVEIAKAYKSMLNKDIDTIVLTSGEDFPDALCAGPLAAKNNAAVLLTNSNHLNKDTKEYIQSNKNIKKAIIVGGENSVSEAVEKELNEIIEVQ
ncbi:MAG: cell wall-binding repeat-containing protein [Peptostreptococcus sp.]|uniref:cell wall-binding repeat-containing protein n=1 Tax=Peptostreptococcus sp. TaxID=1262 RepID=UPI002FCA5D05